MRRFATFLLTLAMAAVTAQAQAVSSTPDSGSATKIAGFDVNAIDKTVNPCDNFYQYACGNWRKNNPIPSDRARWGRFDELNQNNQDVLHEILENAAKTDHKRTAIEAQVGDYYAACMDEKTVNDKGISPLADDLKKIDSAKDKTELTQEMGALRSEGTGLLFGFGVGSDLHDSNKTMMQVSQGGMGLPDRDYYLKTDPKSQEIREKYVEHIANLLKLAGESGSDASAHAKGIMELETSLAKAALDRISLRDPKNRDHKMSADDWKKLAPNFDFNSYIASAKAPQFSDVNVVPPDFFSALNNTWQATSLDTAKEYAKFHLIRRMAPYLSEPFVNESFNFNSKYMRGIKEIQPRWKRCVQFTDGDLGEALGQLYVAKTFGADGKARMQKMVAALTTALEQDINEIDWMTADTKKKAVEKLNELNKKKIGYPDKWRDYSSVSIKRDDLAGNTRRADVFEVNRNYNKYGKPVDKTEWGMTPPTVNAYYSPQFAEIVFPAGILQPPFFDKKMDDAVNFGGIGAVIGHELSHGFDDQGRKFDGEGNLKDWWTDADGKAFVDRSACIDKQYSGYSPVKDSKTGEPVHLKGQLTMGENIGDNGGIRIAYKAMENTLKGSPAAKKKIDGFTPEQRFFLGFAQIWCQNSTDEDSLQRVNTDPHSPGEFRANGPTSNMAEFATAFSCKAGQPMAPENRCRVW